MTSHFPSCHNSLGARQGVDMKDYAGLVLCDAMRAMGGGGEDDRHRGRFWPRDFVSTQARSKHVTAAPRLEESTLLPHGHDED